MDAINLPRSNRSSLADEFSAHTALLPMNSCGNHTLSHADKMMDGMVRSNIEELALRLDDNTDHKPNQKQTWRSSLSRHKCGTSFRIYFSPSGRGIHMWCGIISLVVVYHMWVVIYRYAFSEINRQTIWVWFPLDYFADFLYIIDMVISLRTGFLEDGVMQFNSKRMRVHYLNSTHFYLDCLSLLPFDFLYLSLGFNSMLRILRLCKVYKFWQFLDRAERHASRPNLMRSAKLTFYYFTILHWNACAFKLFQDFMNTTSQLEGPPDSVQNYSKVTVFMVDKHIEKPQIFNESENLSYVSSAYWGMVGLLSVGTFRIPDDSRAYMFGIAQGVVGVLLFATILGHVSNIISHVSAAQKEFQAQLDRVKNYLALRRVPTALQERVIDWFDYLWYMNKITDEENVLNSLPDKLKAEIAIQMHLDTLKRVEIFQNTEEGFLSELVLRLRMVLFAPGDFVCRKGEIGKQMFIVNRGTLHVLGDDNTTILAILRAGSYFGELSILNLGQYGNRRTASVRSLGYSDLFRLSKSDLWDVLKDYPKARRKLESHAYKKIHDYRVLSRGMVRPSEQADDTSYGYNPEEIRGPARASAGATTGCCLSNGAATISANVDGSDGYGSDPSRMSALMCTPRQSPTPPLTLVPNVRDVVGTSTCRSDSGIEQMNALERVCAMRLHTALDRDIKSERLSGPLNVPKSHAYRSKSEAVTSFTQEKVHKNSAFETYINPRISERSLVNSRNLSAPTNLVNSLCSDCLDCDYPERVPEEFSTCTSYYYSGDIVSYDYPSTNITPQPTLAKFHLSDPFECSAIADCTNAAVVSNGNSKSINECSQHNVPLIYFEKASTSSSSSTRSSCSHNPQCAKCVQSVSSKMVHSASNANRNWGSIEHLSVPRTRVQTPHSFSRPNVSIYTRNPGRHRHNCCTGRHHSISSPYSEVGELELQQQAAQHHDNTLLQELIRLQRSVYLLERQNAMLQSNQRTRTSLDSVDQWFGVKTCSPIMEHQRPIGPFPRLITRAPVRRSSSLQVPCNSVKNGMCQNRPIRQIPPTMELRAGELIQTATRLPFGGTIKPEVAC